MSFEDNKIPVAGFTLTYENLARTKVNIEKEVSLRGRRVKFVAQDIEMPKGISQETRDNIEDAYFKKINELIGAYRDSASKVIIGKEGITLIFSDKTQETERKELSWKEIEKLKKSGEDVDFQNFQKLAISFAKVYTPQGRAALTREVHTSDKAREEFALFDLDPKDSNSALTQLIKHEESLKNIEKKFKAAMSRRDISLGDKLRYLVHFKIALSVAKSKLSLPDRELHAAEKTARTQWHTILKSAARIDRWTLKDCFTLLEQYVPPRKAHLFESADEKSSEIEADALELKKIFIKEDETLTSAIDHLLDNKEIVEEKNRLYISLFDQFSKNFAIIHEAFKENASPSLAYQMFLYKMDDEETSRKTILEEILTDPDFTLIMQNALKSVHGEDTLQAYLLLDAIDKQNESHIRLYMHIFSEAIKDPEGLNISRPVKKALTDVLLSKPDLIEDSPLYRDIKGLSHNWEEVSDEMRKTYIDSHYLEIVNFCNHPKHSKEALNLLHKVQNDHPEEFSSLFRNLDRSIAIAYLKKYQDELLENPSLFSPRNIAAYVEDLVKNHPKKLPTVIAPLIEQVPSFIKFLPEKTAEKMMEHVIERIFTNLKMDEDYTLKIALYAQHFPAAIATKFLKEYLLPEQMFLHLDNIPLTIVKSYIQEYPKSLTQANQDLIVKYLDKQLRNAKEIPSARARLLMDISPLIPETSKWQSLRQIGPQETSNILLTNRQLLVGFLQLLYHSTESNDVKYRNELVKECIKNNPNFIRWLPDDLVKEIEQPLVEMVLESMPEDVEGKVFEEFVEYAQYFPSEALAVKFLEDYMIPDVVVKNVKRLPLQIASPYIKAHSNGVTEKTQKYLADYLNQQTVQALKSQGKDFPLAVAQQLLEAGLLAGETEEYFRSQLPVQTGKVAKTEQPGTPQVTRKKAPPSVATQKVEAGTSNSKKIQELKHQIDVFERALFGETPLPKNWKERMLNLAQFPVTTQEPIMIHTILQASKRNEDTQIKGVNAYSLASDLMRFYRELRKLTK